MSVLLEGPEHLHHVCVHTAAVGLLQIHHPCQWFHYSQWTKMKSCCPVIEKNIGVVKCKSGKPPI